MRRGHLRTHSAQAILLRQGDWLTIALLLIVGRAQSLLYSAEGLIVLLHEYQPGDLFGALGEIDPVQQEADVVSLEHSRTLTLPATDLALLAEQHGCIGLALSRMLVRRLRQATARMFERNAISAVGRVYAEISRQARADDALTIRPAPILAELALKVSTPSETASRAVNALERRGIIRRDAAGLVVIAPLRLEELIL